MLYGRSTGTEREVHEGQLWLLEENSDLPGYFYIHNNQYADYRLDRWGTDHVNDVSAKNTWYSDSQMWRFEYYGEGYYRIVNRAYPHEKLCMAEVEPLLPTFTGKLAYSDKVPRQEALDEFEQNPYILSMCDDIGYTDELLWSLEPRFHASVERVVAFHADNRNGKINLPPQNLSMTKGISTTVSSTETKTRSFSASVTFSLGWGPWSGSASASYGEEISSTLSKDTTQTVTETVTKSYTAPAGYDYRVSYLKIKLSGSSPNDNIEFWAPEASLCVEQSEDRLADPPLPLECP